MKFNTDVITLFSLLLFFTTFTLVVAFEDDDDGEDSLADISNLAVHLVGGFGVLLGSTNMIILIYIYNKIGFESMAPQEIQSNLGQESPESPLDTSFKLEYR
jgi:hypothetical protein